MVIPTAADGSWVEMTEVNRILVSALKGNSFSPQSPFRRTLLTQANRLVREVAAQTRSLGDSLPTLPLPDIELPGALVINNAFGEISLNRQTHSLAGSFGGRVEFPNLNNAAFEITSAV